jgi:hypothetical protein
VEGKEGVIRLLRGMAAGRQQRATRRGPGDRLTD